VVTANPANGTCPEVGSFSLSFVGQASLICNNLNSPN
jgi:hypothetical protein